MRKIFPVAALLIFSALVSFTFVIVRAQDSVDDGEDAFIVTNVAAASNGGTATASSTYNASYPASALINGDRKGLGWGSGAGGWHDATWNSFPDTVEIQFSGMKSVGEINIVTLQDNYGNPVEPTPETTFNNFGVRDFNVWYRGADGQWRQVLGVAGNNKVLRSFRFASVVTDRIRVEVLGSPASWHNQIFSRLVEVEAWGGPAADAIEPPPAPTNTPPVCAPDPEIGPCEMSENLTAAMAAAMKGNRSGTLPYSPEAGTRPKRRWHGRLDWTYYSWQQGGSQNIPTLAHALALWRLPSEYGHTSDADAIAWWNKYLDCQTRDASCTPPNSGHLRYWKAAELFSNTYDGETTSAVVAAHVWALNELRTLPVGSARYTTVIGLANRARRYLRLNWSIYTLGVGKGPASKQLNRFNHSDGPIPFDDPSKQVCHGSNYDGPFIALAGMRSTFASTCSDPRATAYARALNWTHGGPQPKIWVRNLLIQTEAVNANKTVYRAENAYALDEPFRALLRRHVNGAPNPGEDTTQLILNFLSNIRTAVRYHFVGARVDGIAGNEARLTLMEDNETDETTAVFVVTYDYPQRLARHLYPWTNRGLTPGCDSETDHPHRAYRDTVTKGYADFRPNAFAPTSVFGSSSNRDGASDCKNYENGIPVTEEFALPSNWVWQYHIVFSRDAPPQRIR